MSRSREFFHGSNHYFEVGDVVSPDHDTYGEGEVHATNSSHWASQYGDYLYQVVPVTTANMVNEHEGVQHWVSRDGYQVVKVLYR